ncbi:hypothetical protein OF83DRAFT_1155366, partial [Amylostereum chailletii]
SLARLSVKNFIKCLNDYGITPGHVHNSVAIKNTHHDRMTKPLPIHARLSLSSHQVTVREVPPLRPYDPPNFNKSLPFFAVHPSQVVIFVGFTGGLRFASRAPAEPSLSISQPPSRARTLTLPRSSLSSSIPYPRFRTPPDLPVSDSDTNTPFPPLPCFRSDPPLLSSSTRWESIHIPGRNPALISPIPPRARDNLGPRFSAPSSTCSFADLVPLRPLAHP